MSSSKTKQMFKVIFTANGGCGCGKPKPNEVIEPKPKGKASSNTPIYHSSSSSWDRGGGGNSIDDTSTTPLPKFGDSVAVVKESDDPYQDFRQSMLQMILEKEIYSKDDLQELLSCFLRLNSPSHHEIIVNAFMDIWNGVVSEKSDPANKQKNQQQEIQCHGGINKLV
ncbi:unnamed protein product [Coffea canephora]|uniref:Transcription repressor n=1 Tax=Coffea canephora TaxID=49390 RepID=A0A068UGU7_COFCA|nr:unnamed protein product [Coffea canephora]